MKTMILYYSNHHGNTEKLVSAIAAADPDVTAVNVAKLSAAEIAALPACDRIGLASGIYGGNFGKPLTDFAAGHLPSGKPVFLLYTAAKPLAAHEKAIRKLITEKGSEVIGAYCCQGYNTFGPFKLIGGTGKGHPSEEEIAGAVAFYQGLA